jgi:hypothetical protein
MTESATFNKMAATLPVDERHNLLERLKSQSVLSGRMLYGEDNEKSSSVDIDTEYSKLPWYYHLWYFFLSFLKSREPLKIYEDNKVAMLGNKIEEKAPGLYDWHKGMLMPLFHRQLVKLKEAAHFFYSALDSSVNRDRGAFFAFLGSLEMPDVHKVLQNDANPIVIAKAQPEMPETELRQAALKVMESAFATITEEKHNTMYFDARSLFCLKELSSFLYDRVLMAFSTDAEGNAETCSAGIVRDLLITLNNILLSLKAVPPMTLLESLFIFILQERSGEQGFDINRESHLLLAKAEQSLAVIKEFNNQVPLSLILRCYTRNMALTPHELSGGEDWYVVYRDYWKKRVDSLYAEYLRDYRQNKLMESFSVFLKGKSLKILENTQSEMNSEGIPIKGAFALSFLYTFYSAVFMPDINLILRSILIEGDFQKKENRVEFAESYNNLIKLEDEIKKFEQDISRSGDYGKRYSQARQDVYSLSIRRRKIQIIIEEIEEEVKDILERVINASYTIINALNGILGRDGKGKYFPLTNLSKVAGKDTQFVTGISDVIQKFELVVKLLDDIEIMENGR